MFELKVLVIDDEEGMRLAVQRSLDGYIVELPDVEKNVRFSVAMASTGEEGLDMIEESPPDILLLDHKLPGISGLEVLGELEKSDPDFMTIMITAYASLETAIIATKRGAFDFLAKPFTPGEMKAAICKASKHLILQRQTKKLQQERRQVRFQFLSVLSHELKAPLAAIQGYLYLMRDKSLGTDISKYDKVIGRCLARIDGMYKMIFDLLDLTRIESGQKKRHLSKVDLCEVARTAVETAEPSAQERGINIHLHAKGPVIIVGDSGELEIIFNNLLSNAVKYNRDGGRVDVKIEDDEENVTLSVSDTGIGMSQKEVERLFNEFVRIKNKKTQNIAGSGLGLSIVKKLSRLYNGTVTAESRPDEGSTFTVTLRKESGTTEEEGPNKVESAEKTEASPLNSGGQSEHS